ncbi:hypothetical protein E2C01_047203 [Portunus trituberculatus]|uniref:Uncharacterized protein n=1 Tax=Portunus trituberculatus TaxID=210409 RepID=A0A5B7G9U1_PORTR|nr:hypothetical protein [Portunus trituberculatus]
MIYNETKGSCKKVSSLHVAALVTAKITAITAVAIKQSSISHGSERVHYLDVAAQNTLHTRRPGNVCLCSPPTPLCVQDASHFGTPITG